MLFEILLLMIKSLPLQVLPDKWRVAVQGHIWFIFAKVFFICHVGLINLQERARDSDSHPLHLHRQWVTLLCNVKGGVTETSWQTHFVVFIYVKPVKWMRKVFPQRIPHVAFRSSHHKWATFEKPDSSKWEGKLFLVPTERNKNEKKKSLLMEWTSSKRKRSHFP